MSCWSEVEGILLGLNSAGVDHAVFQCTSAYPTTQETVGLNLITTMKEKFSCPVGLSDHSGLIYPSILAMARGVSMIEVHATFHKKMFGPDTPASLTVDELASIREFRDAFQVMDNNPVEKDDMADKLSGMKALFNKSVPLKHDQTAGTVLKEDMLTTKKPGTGIPASEIGPCIGKVLLMDTPANRLLRWEDFV